MNLSLPERPPSFIKSIRVVWMDYYPMAAGFENCPRLPTYRESYRCILPGMAVEIIKLIADFLNMTIVDVVVNRTNFLEVIDALADEQYDLDLIGMTFERTDSRLKRYDFTHALYEVSLFAVISTTKIAVRRADTSLSAIFDFFKVYDTITWFNLIAVFIIFTLIGLLVRQVEWRLGFRPRIRGFELIWSMIRLELLQYHGISYHLVSGNTSLLVFAFFQCAIIINLYSTYIITSVVRAKNPWPFDAYDLPWLIREKRYTLYTTKRFDWFREKVQTSMESPFYDFRQAFLVNPIQIRRDEDEVLDEVVGGNGVVILQDDEPISFSADRRCDLVYLPSHIPVEKQRLMMRKGHPFLQQFNYAIRSQSMIIQRTYRKYSEYRDPVDCHDDYTGPKPLTITPYFGVLLLFFTGVSIAIFAFTLEFVLSQI
ncbi:hypothetical protein M3Y98_00687300 [Aphelenchoides besseyi]|nr:hypothetical protein M3Y98_00687300 [Aphelenchoides besseyi]